MKNGNTSAGVLDHLGLTLQAPLTKILPIYKAERPTTYSRVVGLGGALLSLIVIGRGSVGLDSYSLDFVVRSGKVVPSGPPEACAGSSGCMKVLGMSEAAEYIADHPFINDPRIWHNDATASDIVD
jgi:hypothetical protein